jgi:hypothetical protein
MLRKVLLVLLSLGSFSLQYVYADNRVSIFTQEGNPVANKPSQTGNNGSAGMQAQPSNVSTTVSNSNEPINLTPPLNPPTQPAALGQVAPQAQALPQVMPVHQAPSVDNSKPVPLSDLKIDKELDEVIPSAPQEDFKPKVSVYARNNDFNSIGNQTSSTDPYETRYETALNGANPNVLPAIEVEDFPSQYVHFNLGLPLSVQLKNNVEGNAANGASSFGNGFNASFGYGHTPEFVKQFTNMLRFEYSLDVLMNWFNKDSSGLLSSVNRQYHLILPNARAYVDFMKGQTVSFYLGWELGLGYASYFNSIDQQNNTKFHQKTSSLVPTTGILAGFDIRLPQNYKLILGYKYLSVLQNLSRKTQDDVILRNPSRDKKERISFTGSYFTIGIKKSFY